MVLRKGESAGFISKRGTEYIIYNDCGHLLVGKQIVEKQKGGGYASREIYVNPTKEISGEFTVADN